MTNLLQETVRVMRDLNKTPGEVRRIGDIEGKYGCTFDEFIYLADFEYDSGYGAAQIGGDLIVLFTDGTWLEREEYDGSEWWEYKKPPRGDTAYERIRNLGAHGVGCWSSVEKINSKGLS